MPSDSIQLKSGVVDHNYFSGTGYGTGAHADAIAIDGTTGPISITNNFIDSRNAPDARAASTSAIAIGNYYGDNQDITVSKNVLLGGAYTIYVHDFGKYHFNVMDVDQNYVAAGQFGSLYPTGRPASLVYTDNSATNVTSTLLAPVTAAPGLHVSGKAGLANELLRGSDSGDWLYGHGNNDVLAGGSGRDFLFGGKGADIFKFEKASDSFGKGQDLISGFEDHTDKLNLHGVGTLAPLSWLGEAAFNGRAGAVHEVFSGSSSFIEADLNGDKIADFRLEIAGVHHLTAGDLIL